MKPGSWTRPTSAGNSLVAAGRAPECLLDSYGQERGPLATQVLGFTQNLVKFGTAARSLKRALRDASLPAFRLPPVQRHLAGRMSQTGMGYPHSPLTRPGRVGDPPGQPGLRMVQQLGQPGPMDVPVSDSSRISATVNPRPRQPTRSAAHLRAIDSNRRPATAPPRRTCSSGAAAPDVPETGLP